MTDDLSSYFGVRPGVLHRECPAPFITMPEDKRPYFSFTCWTESERAEYTEGINEMVGATDIPASDDPLEAVKSINKAVRNGLVANSTKLMARHDALLRRHLRKIENYPLVEGDVLNWSAKADEPVPNEVWDCMNVKLRPVLLELVQRRASVTKGDAQGVKS